MFDFQSIKIQYQTFQVIVYIGIEFFLKNTL